MPLNASLKAGNIVGPGPDKLVPISWFFHQISTDKDPTDPDSELKVRNHSLFTVRKQVDLTTPFFHQYQTLGSKLPSWELRLFDVPFSGPSRHYLSIFLKDALVVQIETTMPDLSDPKYTYVHEFEDISFAYSEISWQNVPGSAKATDKTDSSFFPDWAEEKARAEVTKQYAELKSAGVGYAGGLLSQLIAFYKKKK
jgi:type VI secretion system secreted protein Hcp